jgi:hypothetical protein
VFPVTSSSRNSRENTLYLGVDNNFQPDLVLNANVGASYQNSYNANPSSDNYAPYVLANLTYTYAPSSTASIGVQYDFSAFGYSGGLNPVTGSYPTGSEAATVFAALTHALTAKLTANLVANFQNNLVNGGTYDGETQQYYSAGVYLNYQFTRNLGADVGYNYDRLVSHLTGQDLNYDRNRVYVGVTASY